MKTTPLGDGQTPIIVHVGPQTLALLDDYRKRRAFLPQELPWSLEDISLLLMRDGIKVRAGLRELRLPRGWVVPLQ